MSNTNGNSNALVILTEFERRLAACTTLGETKAMRDQAEALRYYCQTMQVGIVAQNRCATARFIAEYKLGEMLTKLPRAPGPGRGKKISPECESFLKRIEAEGIRYYDARRWQWWARVPEQEFRRLVDALCADTTTEADTSAYTCVLDSKHVDSQVSYWLTRRRTPEKKAELEVEDARQWAEHLAREEAAQAEEESYRQDPTGHLLQAFAARQQEARDVLLALHVDNDDDRVTETDLRDMLALTDQLLARCDKMHRRWWRGLGRPRDTGLLRFVS